MNVTKRTWAEISLDNIRKNFHEIKNQVKDTKICCVIKADGYGHGAVELAWEYEKLGADFLAVSNLDEAKELRLNNINLPILILGYTDVNCAEELAENNISQAVYSLEYAQALHNKCKEKNVDVNIHIKLDTGMSRIGFMCQEFPRDNNSIKEIFQTCSMEHFNVEGVFTHFCVSDEGKEGNDFTKQQYKNFTHTISELKNMGINFKYVHCSNSGAVEDYPETYNTMVRAGIILYGLKPSDKINNNLDIVPAMTVKSVVANVKTIEKGATVSYGRTFTAQRKMKIATIPIGYADGYIRAYGKNGYMMINGQRADIIGRICMDQTMVDVTGIDNVKIGDEVMVFGSGEFGEQTADDLAKTADTINYEVVCTISKRVPRCYKDKGKITKVMYKI